MDFAEKSSLLQLILLFKEEDMLQETKYNFYVYVYHFIRLVLPPYPMTSQNIKFLKMDKIVFIY